MSYNTFKYSFLWLYTHKKYPYIITILILIFLIFIWLKANLGINKYLKFKFREINTFINLNFWMFKLKNKELTKLLFNYNKAKEWRINIFHSKTSTLSLMSSKALRSSLKFSSSSLSAYSNLYYLIFSSLYINAFYLA